MITDDATSLGSQLSAGKVTAVELANRALGRIAEEDARIRAFITTLPETAAAEATASDARRQQGKTLGPLDGVPFAVKDNIAIAGVPTSCGTSVALEPSATDATTVGRLRAAGTVLIGSLNLHEGALGATTDNPFHGQCQNPLAAHHTPGGSSGGSAAAIAAGMVPLSLGTDTMGSVRIPAAYCGLWGLKPSFGRIPVSGLVHLSWTLDTIGPLARSADDLALMFAALQGHDPLDQTSIAQSVPCHKPVTVGGLRLGIPDIAALADCEPIISATFSQAIEALRAAGMDIAAVEIAGWEPEKLRRAGLLVSEVEGATVLGDAVDRPGLSVPFRAMLDYGRKASAARVASAYRALQHAGVAARNSLTRSDALIMPTAPQRAFAHSAPTPVNQADFTALANAAGLPALSLPLPAMDGGLPAALQLVGPWGSDERLIEIGALVARLLSRDGGNAEAT